MAVSNQSIIDKMKKELQQAEQQHQQEIMQHHISRVQLLCDLLLQPEKTAVGQQPEITAEEMKVMFGEAGTAEKAPAHNRIDHGDANGSSIFDF